MKIFASFLLLGLSLFSFGCGSSQDSPPLNTKLDALQRVGKNPDYFYSSDLECRVLTATQTSEIGTVFRLYNLNTKTPTIGLPSISEPIALERVGAGPGKIAFVAVNNTYGQSYILFDKATGVFSFSNIEFLRSGEKSTLRGNCLPFQKP